MTKIFMGDYYTINEYGLVRTIARAKSCETDKNMIMFAVVGEGGLHKETLLLNEEDFIKKITSSDRAMAYDSKIKEGDNVDTTSETC